MTRRLRRRPAAQHGGAIEDSTEANPLVEWLLKVFGVYRPLNDISPRQFKFIDFRDVIPEFNSTDNYPMPQRLYQRDTDKIWAMEFEPPQGANPAAYYLNGNYGLLINNQIRSLTTSPARLRVSELNSVEFQTGINENLQTQPENVRLLLDIERLLRAILRASITDTDVIQDDKVKEQYTGIVGDITTLNDDYYYPLLIWAVGLNKDIPKDIRDDDINQEIKKRDDELIPVLTPMPSEPSPLGGSAT